jgi:nitrogenase-stabilizing/protective protein
MGTLDELSRLSAAEDFFAVLEVEFQPEVVNVARLHILRRMGQYLRDTELESLDDAAIRAACRSHLERAYADFQRSTPIAERLFKVHQDAIKPTVPESKPFVPLSVLTGHGG